MLFFQITADQILGDYRDGKRGSVAKYVVRLSCDERARLEDLIGTGRQVPYRLLKARILLKADVSAAGGGWG
ncbi:MAG: hypothetical protein GY717_10525 [Rhodobacteraceae bacterium]|nr:hypothetical protein [Paracoccaceae bacterium]